MPQAAPGPRRRLDRRFALIALAAALGWSGWLAHLHLAGRATPLDRIESALTDLRLRLAGPRRPPADVVIVAIDDETVRREGGFPVPRAAMTRIVETIAASRPRALAVDVLFLEAGRQPEADRALGTALAAVPAVLAAAAVFEGGASEDGIPVAAALHRPVPEIGRAAASGLVNVSEDAAGVPRHLPLVVRTGRTSPPPSCCAPPPWRAATIRSWARTPCGSAPRPSRSTSAVTCRCAPTDRSARSRR